MPAEDDVNLESDAAREAREAEERTIHDMIFQYSQEHGHGHITNDTYFVVGTYGCPGQFGNRMHEFLNAFALAVITQRTLVWRYTNQATGVHEVGTLEECSKFLTRRTWIQSAEILPQYNADIVEMNWDTNVEVACAGVHEERARAIAPGKKLEQYQMSTLAQPGANISPELARRARTLMARGPEYLFGKLFEAAFRWSAQTVVRPTIEVLQGAGLIDAREVRKDKDSLWVAVHVRHKDIDDTVEMRDNLAGHFAEAITASVLRAKRKSCAVFLATDDDVTENLLKPKLANVSCSVVRSRMGKPQPDFKDEHGNNTGVGAMRDLFLLSHADMLVGTSFSSFSMVSAEHLRTRQGSAVPLWRCLDSKRDIPCRQQDEMLELTVPEGMCPGNGGSETQLTRTDVGSEVLATAKIDQMMSSYISDYLQHDSANLSSHRPAVVCHDSHPDNPVVMLRELANALAVAMITERALIWEGPSPELRHPHGTNAEGRNAAAAMVGLSELIRKAVPGGQPPATRIANAGDLACASFDAEHVPLLGISGMTGYEASALHESGAALTPQMKHRADVLFALGPEYLYGRLMKAAFTFDHNEVVAPVLHGLRQAGLVDEEGRRNPRNAVWTSILANHKSTGISKGERAEFAHLLWSEALKTVETRPRDQACVVLLGGDDKSAGDIIRPLANKEECTLVTSAAIISALPQARRAQWAAKQTDALQETFFLSMADALVGTAWSSTTQTVAEMIVAKRPSATFVQCMPHSCTRSREWFPRPIVPPHSCAEI